MTSAVDDIRDILSDLGVSPSDVQERQFPGEHWLIIYVPRASLITAQSLAGDAERKLNSARSGDEEIILTFRPEREKVAEHDRGREARGRLHSTKIDQLIQLLEARSRTSDALPSLQYMEDPRASLAATSASRHQLIFGRRGVGKTALMLESKRISERSGHATAWINAHVLRGLGPHAAFIATSVAIVDALRRNAGTSTGSAFVEIERQGEHLKSLVNDDTLPQSVAAALPALNAALRGVLRDGLVRLYVYIDDFYLFALEEQPTLLDLLAGMLRDCDGWIKIASIERLTRPWDPSNRVGLEIPHDASKVDLDVTLEDPAAAQQFLESVLGNYVKTAGLRGPESVAKPEARGRLVLASGGVPRDYLNLVASSIVVARTARQLAKEIGKEDVAQAAGQSARSKRRDLEQDVSSKFASNLLLAQDRIAAAVRAEGYTYFRVDLAQKGHSGYELLAQLVDLRFAHLVQAGLSDQHRAGVKYEAYVLDLSEFSDVRLKRGLNVLDLEAGRWSWRLTGRNRTIKTLSGTQFRDLLRQSPLVDLSLLDDIVGLKQP